MSSKISPVKGETMQREFTGSGRYDPFLFDELGYTRLTPLSPNHCPIKTLKGVRVRLYASLPSIRGILKAF